MDLINKAAQTASAEINTQALMHLKYTPSVGGGKLSVEKAARDMQRAKLLGDAIDGRTLSQVRDRFVAPDWAQPRSRCESCWRIDLPGPSVLSRVSR